MAPKHFLTTPDGSIVDDTGEGHCHIKQVEAAFGWRCVSVSLWNRVTWLALGKQKKQVKLVDVTKPLSCFLQSSEVSLDAQQLATHQRSSVRSDRSSASSIVVRASAA